jgi:hypothetical protein
MWMLGGTLPGTAFIKTLRVVIQASASNVVRVNEAEHQNELRRLFRYFVRMLPSVVEQEPGFPDCRLCAGF